MPPSYVKTYVKRGKTDAADAEAICEAVTRPTMRFVPAKTEVQQACLVELRSCDLLVRQRTQATNALRSHLAEFGIVAGLVPDPHSFASARHFTAWLGLTPKPHSSGSKERLGRISAGCWCLAPLPACAMPGTTRRRRLGNTPAGVPTVQGRSRGTRQQDGPYRLGAADQGRGLPRICGRRLSGRVRARWAPRPAGAKVLKER